MIDEKKQIDEMARVVCDNCAGQNPCNTAKSGNVCRAALYNVEPLYAAGYRKMPKNMGEMSDGYHTFNELYHHRAVLFAVICNMMPDRAWKSKLHDTGDMFDGMFIVGIETEQGQATYHYDIDPYWDMFKVKELDRAPKWDGHTPYDAIERIGALSCEGYREQKVGEWKQQLRPYEDEIVCSSCGASFNVIDNCTETFNFCPNCGAWMEGRNNNGC